MSSGTMVQDIPVVLISAGQNDRRDFNVTALEDLASSILQHGLAQPITVRKSEAGYEIVAGERRFRAISTLLHWETIPVIVRDLDDESASAIMLAENTSREDLNPIEEAEAYQSRIDRYGWSESKIAKIAGVTKDRVKSRLKLLRLIPEAQVLVRSGQLAISYGELISSLDVNRQRIILRIYNRSGGMKLNQLKSAVGKLLQEQSQDSLFSLENFWVEQILEHRLRFKIWGKGAETEAPQSDEIPVPEIRKEDSIGQVFDRYAWDLWDKGYHTEAQAVGNLYQVLAVGRKVMVQRDPDRT